jgi:hypothetical protein
MAMSWSRPVTLEPVVPGQPDRQMAGPAPHFKDLCTIGIPAATSAAMRCTSGYWPSTAQTVNGIPVASISRW